MQLRSAETCFEPSLSVERVSAGVDVVPVAGELSRRLHYDLAVLICSRHRPASVHIDYLKPRRQRPREPNSAPNGPYGESCRVCTCIPEQREL